MPLDIITTCRCVNRTNTLIKLQYKYSVIGRVIKALVSLVINMTKYYLQIYHNYQYHLGCTTTTLQLLVVNNKLCGKRSETETNTMLHVLDSILIDRLYSDYCY